MPAGLPHGNDSMAVPHQLPDMSFLGSNSLLDSSHKKDTATAGTSTGPEVHADRNDQSMASILARFRDSEILGADKEPASLDEISPASGYSSLHAQSQSLYPELPNWPSIRAPSRPGPSHMRSQLFATSLLSQLPSPEYCRQYVDAYFKHTAWEIFAICQKQFLGELHEFEALRLQGEASEVDPAWLAVLLIVSSARDSLNLIVVQGTDRPVIVQVISMGLLTAYHAPSNPWGEAVDSDLRRASAYYAELSKTALELADWTSSPSIRVLQAVLVTGWRYHHADARSNSFDGQGRSCLAYRSLLHVAYEHCCALNIDKLQSDPNATVGNDPSLPNASPAMRRQFGLRLWFTYLVVETLLSDHQFHRQGPITEYVLPGMFTGECTVV